ncbi:PaaI family thioesterase [Pseudorhodoferax sp.]|uniref:PaaI family thioesterase n=1 Tax=Pseudorhodoferax sp. TaxID=1993553 RepID=UPI0039E3DB4C
MNSFSLEAPDTLFGLRIPIAQAFGLRGVRIGDDQATVLMPADPRYTNSRGDVHGGAYAVLMDAVLSCAARAHAPSRYGVITVDLVLHYVAGTRGDVIATARCERRGKSLCFVRGEARDADGTLLTLATGTFKLVERAPAP